jgi:ribose transport system permease protein
VGFINGIVITKLGLTPIVTTIAMNGLLFGVMLLSLTLSEFTDVPPLLTAFTSQKFDFFGLSIAWILPLTIGLMLVLQFLLSYRGWVRGLFVLGSAPAAARLAGLVILGYYKQAEPFMGTSFLLGSVAVVVVGGASVFGGRGSVIGTFFGALVLIQVNNLVFLLNLGTNFQNLIYGVIVLVAAYGRSKLLK